MREHFRPMLILLLSLFNFHQCQVQRAFRNESVVPSPSLHPILQSRAKRQYSSSSSSLSSSSPSCGGCPSKFTPINCKCTSTANDDLLCRCDRAILANVRDEPDRPQCPCSRRAVGGESGANFRGEISELTSRVQNLATGIQSACHPICHQSCLNSCTRPPMREIDSYRGDRGGGGDRYPPPFMANDHPQPQHQYPIDQVPAGCQPSLCRANCLRACSRILEGGQRSGDFAGDRAAPSNSYQENGIEPSNHYEVRPTDRLPPEYPQFAGGKGSSLEGGGGGVVPPPSPSGGGGTCQCSSAAFCDCPETCFPLCFETCESNCNSNNPQASQRRMCAQTCHYECQRNCAEKQRQQKQQTGNGQAAGNNGGNNEVATLSPLSIGNSVWPMEPANPQPAQIYGNNKGNSEFLQENGGGASGPPASCRAKCPKSCESACSIQQQQQQQNDDPANCVPACVAVCAQSCARGHIQLDQQQLPSNQISQQQQNVMAQPLMEAFEGPKMMAIQQTLPMAALTFNLEDVLKEQANGTVEEEEEGGRPAETEGQANGRRQQLPPTMFLNDGGGAWPPSVTAAATPFATQPCAPLCQPECKPECNRRYMEERRPTEKQRPYRGIGNAQIGHQGQNWKRNEPTGPRNGQSQIGPRGDFPGLDHPKMGTSSPPLFPPHYILPLADDLEQVNETQGTILEGRMMGGGKAMDDEVAAVEELEALLRPQNETGNSTQIGAKNREKEQMKMKPLVLAKPWKGKAKSGGEEFFKRRMGKMMKGARGGVGEIGERKKEKPKGGGGHGQEGMEKGGAENRRGGGPATAAAVESIPKWHHFN